MPLLGTLLVGTLAAAAAPAPVAAAASDDRPIPIRLIAATAQVMYRSQLVGDLDRPVGEAITVAGRTVPTRATAQGGLEVDPTGGGKFQAVSKGGTLTVTSERVEDKSAFPVRLWFDKNAAGMWTYRNVTVLTIALASEQLVIVDANGNGVWNEPGVDGIAWPGADYIFPLPAADERWCTPTLDCTGLAFGPLGQDAKLIGKPLATVLPECLPILNGVNAERVRIGLTPRPESPALSADLQKHCQFMAQNKSLQHPEEPDKPGYSREGNSAGMRSILSMGTPPPRIAAMMVQTYFHRQDVIRPETTAFGVGFASNYGGIDGRSARGKIPASAWPVLCPAPGNAGVGLTYGHESPDAIPGQTGGYPITVYFASGKLSLDSYKLCAVAGDQRGPAVDCHVFDPQTGVSANMTGYQRCCCLIAKEPLAPSTTYEVSMQITVGGQPWTRTWQFTTGTGARGPLGGGGTPRAPRR